MNIGHILATKGTKVITIEPERSVREALALLAAHNIGALVAIDTTGQPVGILSERDIVRQAARREDIFALTVSAIMTTDLVTGLPQDDLLSVAHTMTEHRIRHLPVVENGKLVGVVSIGDIVKAQRDEYEGEVDTLQTQILQMKPEDPRRSF
jgi:CBS domain-containing protein